MATFLRKLFSARGLSSAGGLSRGNPLVEATRAIQQAMARQALAGQPAPAAPAPAPAARPLNDSPQASGIGRFEAGSFSGAFGSRSYKLFEPGRHEGRALPLVVMLHGCTQDADDFAAGTRMNALAEERGLFVLYPEQAPRSNANKCWNWFVPGDQRRGHGEPALIAAMTRHVMKTHAIDADRVYVAGLSAGGAMAAILAREYPDLYAAAGVHSGLAPGAAHDVASAFAAMQSGPSQGGHWRAGLAKAMPAAAWTKAPDEPSKGEVGPASGAPLIVFHGDADATVNAQNGVHVVAAALGTTGHSQTRETPAAPQGGRAFTRVVYRSADDPADMPSRAEHWVVHGAAHAWSGGDAAGSFTDRSGPDASREMLRFFAEHPLRHEAAVLFTT